MLPPVLSNRPVMHVVPSDPRPFNAWGGGALGCSSELDSSCMCIP